MITDKFVCYPSTDVVLLLPPLLQSLWASPADRRDVLWKCVFWYAILFAVPTGTRCSCCNHYRASLCSAGPARKKWSSCRFHCHLFTHSVIALQQCELWLLLLLLS